MVTLMSERVRVPPQQQPVAMRVPPSRHAWCAASGHPPACSLHLGAADDDVLRPEELQHLLRPGRERQAAQPQHPMPLRGRAPQLNARRVALHSSRQVLLAGWEYPAQAADPIGRLFQRVHIGRRGRPIGTLAGHRRLGWRFT